jgi:iron complex outermembrane receptor protein
MHFPFSSLLTPVVLVAAAHAQLPDESPLFDLNIQAQPMGQALRQFADDTGIAVYYPNSGLDKITSEGVVGAFTVQEALRKLINCKGLQAQRLSETTFWVKPQKSGAPFQCDEETVKHLPPATVPSDGNGGSTAALEQVLVGSRIPRRPDGDSAVIIFDRHDIDRFGAVTTDQFVRSIVQNFGRVNPTSSTGGTIDPQTGNNVGRGTCFDLRGLGPGATLILLNGQRLAPGGYDGSCVDVAMIPLAAVERIEVLLDSASAIYGSDAIAGVVNFVMRPEYYGAEITPYYRDVTGGGGGERGLSLLAGDVWRSGGGMFTYQNDQQQPVNASSRETLLPQSGPDQAIPSEKSQNGLVTLHETLATGTVVSADGFVSQRNSSQQYSSGALGSTQSDGKAKMVGGSVTAKQVLPGDWHTDVVGSDAQEDEAVRTSAAQVDQLYHTHATSASIEWGADGPVFSIPGGPVKLSMGTSYRWESFNDYVAPGATREVLGAYAEIFAPIVSDLNSSIGAQRLELSLAIRRDAYRNEEPGVADVASKNPKIGIMWRPFEGFTLRGTFATSFRVAPIAQLIASKDTAVLFQLPNPNVPRGVTNTLYLTGGNSALRPEVARNFTAGFELMPGFAQGVSLSATYFHVCYTNRIAAPPVVGPVTSIFSQLGSLSPYINSAPSPAEIHAAYTDYTVQDPTQIGRGGVQAIFNGQLQNIASTEASGVETALQAKIDSTFGELSFYEQGQYLAQLNNQAAPTTPYAPAVGTVFNPPKLRMQAGTDWSYLAWAAAMMLDYTSSFRDTLTPGSPHVGSWLTLNSSVSYSTGPRFVATAFSHMTFSLSVSNLTNRPAPFVKGLSDITLGYDPTNASVLGRVILFEVRKCL